jgi:hypothetical protein
MAIMIIAVVLVTGSRSDPLLFFTYVVLVVILLTGRRKIFYSIAGVLFVYVCTAILPFPSNSSKPWDVAHLFERYRPRFTLSDYAGDKATMARYVGAHTPEDAVVVAPPLFGILRLVGKRALVVDYKAFPFQEQAAKEWYTRILHCYGTPETTGYAAARELDFNYFHIPDRVLHKIGEVYGASYAILYKETKTTLPKVYENETYKLVSISDAHRIEEKREEDEARRK